jgi:hypothetical protein
MKKVVRIKESELVTLIDKIITETTRKQKISEGVRKLNKFNKNLKENFDNTKKDRYLAVPYDNDYGTTPIIIYDYEVEEYEYSNYYDVQGPFTEKEANDYIKKIEKEKKEAGDRYAQQIEKWDNSELLDKIEMINDLIGISNDKTIKTGSINFGDTELRNKMLKILTVLINKDWYYVKEFFK